MTQKVRRCRDEDLSRLFDIFKEFYPYNLRLREKVFFDWQFRCTPFGKEDEYTFWLVTEHEEIKGFLGYVPIEFRYQGRILQGVLTHNWGVLGGQASGIKLLSTVMAEYDHRFHFGLTDQSVQLYSLLKIPLLMRMPRLVAVAQPERAEELFGLPPGKYQDLFVASRQRLEQCRPCSSIRRSVSFDPAEEFLLDRWPGVNCYCRRTGRYLNWRYVEIPGHDYRIIRDDDGQFAVYRIEPITGCPESVIRIVEWNFQGRRAEAAISFLAEEAEHSAAVLLDFFCTAESLRQELASYGFIDELLVAEGVPSLFRPIHRDGGIRLAIDLPPHRKPRPCNFGEWYITKGDGDLDRQKR